MTQKYKIIIVDDEPIVREGIRDVIPWEEYGFNVVGDFEDGKDAIEAVEKLKPDIVLTDICMPFVDGLELATFIAERYPDIKVVILTGYDNFKYAQKAIKLHTFDFILKPITSKEIINIFKKLHKVLDEKYQKLEELNNLKKQLNESLPLLKERFLNRLITEELDQSEIVDKLENLKVQFYGNFQLLFIVDIDKPAQYQKKNEYDLNYLKIFYICGKILAGNKKCIIFQNNKAQTVIIISENNNRSAYEYGFSIAEEIKQLIEGYKICTVTIGIGTVCNNIQNLSKSYKEALNALEYRFFLGNDQIIYINDIPEYNKNSRVKNNEKEWINKVIVEIRRGTQKSIEKIIDKIFKNIRVSYTSLSSCLMCIQLLLASIITTINDLDIDGNEICDINTSNLFSEMYKFKTIDEIELWLKNICKKINNLIINKRINFYQKKTIDAIEYICANYNNPELSLTIISDVICISRSHFSMIFKKHTGKTFIEYLTKVRIEKAMELIKTNNLRINEISYKVGYIDPHYFSLLFKKNTGMTPTEYNNKIISNSMHIES